MTVNFYYGVMGSGKSTLLLQMLHNLSRAGRGRLYTRLDRAGPGFVASRLGPKAEAVEVSHETDFVRSSEYDFLICDEVQFYTTVQIEQLAVLADRGTEVHAFGLLTDFRSQLFPGSKRLVELADNLVKLHLPVPCWCGALGTQNARVLDGIVVSEGDTVLVGDVGGPGASYVVLCRKHYTTANLGSCDG